MAPRLHMGWEDLPMNPASPLRDAASPLRAIAQSPARLAAQKIELLLSEKRTALSLLRTAIAVLTLPLSIVTVLVATSTYYHAAHALPLVVPLVGVCAALAAVGVYLLARSFDQLHRLDRRIAAIKEATGALADLLV